jgi:serine/threonine-protein kinase HipA
MPEKKAGVYFNGSLAGYLSKINNRYALQYDKNYLADSANPAISLAFPKRIDPYYSDILFPFFYGLLAEGDNKELQCRILKIDETDHFTRLLKTAEFDTIGGITVREI